MLLLMLLLLLLDVAALPSSSAQLAVACGCDAEALYSVTGNETLFDICNRFQVNDYRIVQSLSNISDPNNISPGLLLRIPFYCDCQSGAMPAHTFSYAVQHLDQDNTIPARYYSNLTTVEAIDSANPGGAQVIGPGQALNIPINCSCGSSSVSDLYGLFGTYAVQVDDTSSSLSHQFNVSQELLRQYNPNINFDPLPPILFIPLTNSSGQYPPFVSSVSPAGGVGQSKQGIIIGVAVGGGVFFVVSGLGLWFLCARCGRPSQKEQSRAQNNFTEAFDPVTASATRTMLNNNAFSEKSSNQHGALPAKHCINFSYEELAAATNNFNLSKQIGKGGFATVFYGEWRGQKLAVKRMDMKAQKEFSNELAILSSVHHANLVALIGFCTEGYLFLVYEYVDNGTLDHHLHPGSNPLKWSTRVEIALDTARGIEYIHEHTRPTYIHRDLKPNNILLDSNFHAKVGDFGLTRLLDRDGDGWTKTFSTYGTFGYMAPEYAQFGQISAKLDVFSFGVILFQLVSGRKAIGGLSEELQSLFEAVLGRSDAEEEFKHLVDPALGTDYPVQSVWKVVKLAARCTQKQPERRPRMREVVMQLMTLSEATQGS